MSTKVIQNKYKQADKITIDGFDYIVTTFSVDEKDSDNFFIYDRMVYENEANLCEPGITMSMIFLRKGNDFYKLFRGNECMLEQADSFLYLVNRNENTCRVDFFTMDTKKGFEGVITKLNYTFNNTWDVKVSNDNGKVYVYIYQDIYQVTKEKLVYVTQIEKCSNFKVLGDTVMACFSSDFCFYCKDSKKIVKNPKSRTYPHSSLEFSKVSDCGKFFVFSSCMHENFLYYFDGDSFVYKETV